MKYQLLYYVSHFIILRNLHVSSTTRCSVEYLDVRDGEGWRELQTDKLYIVYCSQTDKLHNVYCSQTIQILQINKNVCEGKVGNTQKTSRPNT